MIQRFQIERKVPIEPDAGANAGLARPLIANPHARLGPQSGVAQLTSEVIRQGIC
jgi:hypothetical protein